MLDKAPYFAKPNVTANLHTHSLTQTHLSKTNTLWITGL